MKGTPDIARVTDHRTFMARISRIAVSRVRSLARLPIQTSEIEPLKKIEQENWLDKLITDILSLNKKEYADIIKNLAKIILNSSFDNLLTLIVKIITRIP